MKFFQIFKNGIFKENPIFVQLIGMCSTLAVTTSAINGIGMGLALTAVLVASNVVISLLRNIIPDKIRIPAYVVIIATFTTIVDMLLEAYVPALYEALGLFIPLIVVNCLILARAEAFSSKNGLIASLADGIGMGLGYALALTILGIIREILGAGTILGIQIMPAGFEPVGMMLMPPGAFLTLGLLIGLINKVSSKRAQ